MGLLLGQKPDHHYVVTKKQKEKKKKKKKKINKVHALSLDLSPKQLTNNTKKGVGHLS